MGVNLFAALVLLLIVFGVALKLREEPLTAEEEPPTTYEEELMLMEDEQDAQDILDILFLDEEEDIL